MDTQAQGAETEELEPTNPNGDDPGAQGAGGEEGAGETPEPVKALARDMGWTDRDQYSGPPENWKPAEQFIRDGRDIQRTTSRELTAVRGQLDTLTRTIGNVTDHEVNRRVEELSGRYQKAVDDGDPQAAYRLANEIGSLTTPKPQMPSGPGPEAQEFAQRNGSWFGPGKDALGTALAVDICNRLAGQGYDHPTQLAAAEKEVRRVYPHLFAGQMNGHKPQAGVNSPGSRGPMGGNRAKGFGDMPLNAQKVANDMIERGVIKDTPDNARKLFAKNYWQNEQRNA